MSEFTKIFITTLKKNINTNNIQIITWNRKGKNPSKFFLGSHYYPYTKAG